MTTQLPKTHPSRCGGTSIVGRPCPGRGPVGQNVYPTGGSVLTYAYKGDTFDWAATLGVKAAVRGGGHDSWAPTQAPSTDGRQTQ
jgi:hypothetical protein